MAIRRSARVFAARAARSKRDRAFGARAGRQGVRRLDRRLPASDRSGRGPAHEGAGVRRCAPVLGVDLRPGDAGPAHGVMAGGAPEHAGVVRGRAEHARPGPVRDCGRPHAPRVDGDPTPTGGIWNSPGITGPRSCRRAGPSPRDKAPVRGGRGPGRAVDRRALAGGDVPHDHGSRTTTSANGSCGSTAGTPLRGGIRGRNGTGAGERQMLPPCFPRSRPAPASGGRPRCPRTTISASST